MLRCILLLFKLVLEPRFWLGLHLSLFMKWFYAATLGIDTVQSSSESCSAQTGRGEHRAGRSGRDDGDAGPPARDCARRPAGGRERRQHSGMRLHLQFTESLKIRLENLCFYQTFLMEMEVKIQIR